MNKLQSTKLPSHDWNFNYLSFVSQVKGVSDSDNVREQFIKWGRLVLNHQLKISTEKKAFGTNISIDCKLLESAACFSQTNFKLLLNLLIESYRQKVTTKTSEFESYKVNWFDLFNEIKQVFLDVFQHTHCHGHQACTLVSMPNEQNSIDSVEKYEKEDKTSVLSDGRVEELSRRLSGVNFSNNADVRHITPNQPVECGELLDHSELSSSQHIDAEFSISATDEKSHKFDSAIKVAQPNSGLLNFGLDLTDFF